MESTRYGVKTNDFSSPSSIAQMQAMIDARLAEMNTDDTWKERSREYDRRTAHARRAARGVPERFLDATLSGWAPDSQDKAKAKAELLSWVSMLGRPGAPSLVIRGANGTGKTWAACGILNDRLDGLYTGEGLDNRRVPEMEGQYITAKGYTDKVKATYRGGATETEKQVLDAYADVPLLVLDEVGRQFDTENERNYLFELINERYNRHRQTALLSNLDGEEFRAFMGPAVMDRLAEGSRGALVFNWPSLRT